MLAYPVGQTLDHCLLYIRSYKLQVPKQVDTPYILQWLHNSFYYQSLYNCLGQSNNIINYHPPDLHKYIAIMLVRTVRKEGNGTMVINIETTLI